MHEGFLFEFYVTAVYKRISHEMLAHKIERFNLGKSIDNFHLGAEWQEENIFQVVTKTLGKFINLYVS